MISYREEYFKSFLKEDILKASSFGELKKCIDAVYLYGPRLDKEEEGFINDAKRTIEILQAIFRKPHVSIKDEEAVLRSGIAPALDNQSFLKTMEDASLWKRKDGKMTPEHVHVNLVTDTFILYENIFVCKVLDFISTELDNLYKIYERRAGSIDNKFETSDVTYSKHGFIARLDKYGYPYSDVLSDPFSNTYLRTKTVSSLIKKCTLLKTTAFYKEVSLAKARRKEIVMTNILLKDRRYFLCYKFFKQYLATKSESEYLQTYKDYIFLRMIRDLRDDYTFAPRSYNVSISYQNKIKVNSKIILYNKLFNYYLEKVDDGFIVNVKFKNDESEMTKHFILPVLEVNKENVKAVKTLVNDKYDEGYESVIVLTLRNNTRERHNIVCVSFNRDDDRIDALRNIFKSYSLIFSGDASLYEELCPKCGRKGVRKKEDTYICPSCASKYKHILVEDKTCIWLKCLGRN